MRQKTILRVAMDILVIISVSNGWWFIALPLTIACLWIFPFYMEIFIAGLGYDSLFGGTAQASVLNYIGTITAILMSFMVISLKRLIR